MKIVILAAGYAVRLQPLTLDMPKPLLKIGGRAMIDRIIDRIDELEENRPIYVVSNGKFFRKFEEWLAASGCADKISLINDHSTANENRLGAVRDLELAIDQKRIDDDLLVIAGDNLFNMDLNDFLRFARSRSDGISFAVYDIGNPEAAKNFGVVKIDDNNKVVDFEEKPKSPKSTLISTGIYYFPRAKIARIKEYVKLNEKLDAPGYHISWLSKNDKVYGFSFEEDWYDIGNIESYKKADAEYSKKEKERNGKE
jgi:glucose-1-phosphate thymidylyltransferase